MLIFADKKIGAGCLLVLVVWLSTVAAAQAETGPAGYAVVNPVATVEQIDLLAVVVSMRFPAHVETVGEAVTLLLERSGYRLAFGTHADPELATLLALPLPQVHRTLNQVRLREALQALAGTAWVLVEDPVNRLVSFDLDGRYRYRPTETARMAREEGV